MEQHILNMLAKGLRVQKSAFTFFIPTNKVIIETDLYPAFKHPNLAAIIMPINSTMGGKEKLCYWHGVYGHFDKWGQFEARMKKHLKCTPFSEPRVEILSSDLAKIIFDIEPEAQKNFGFEQLIAFCESAKSGSFEKFFPGIDVVEQASVEKINPKSSTKKKR